MAATMKDIARRTGLGLATISSYFNGGNVREKNRIKIEEAIEELHYEVNEVARGLKTNATKTVGVVIPELNNVFCAEIISGMEDILRSHGYAAIVCDCRTDKNLEREAVDFLTRKRVDGIINMPVDMTGSHLKEFQRTGKPIVLIDRMIQGLSCDCVLVDNEMAAEKAVTMLVEQEHHKIGLIGGPDEIYTARQRMLGYIKALKKHGIPVDEKLICHGDYTIQGGVLGGEVKDVLLLDVTPLSLGLETEGHIFTRLIDRNTTIPTSKSQVFSTAADGQTTVEINVLQGERQMAYDNKSLGRFQLTGIAPAPRGVPQIEVTFSIDANGIVNVSAKDKATGNEQKITITASSNLTEEEINQRVKEAEQYAEQDKKRKEEVETLNHADSMIYEMEKQLRENGDKLSAEDKATVESEIANFKKVREGNNAEEIKNAMDAFTQKVYAIFGKLYQQQGGEQGANPEQPQAGTQNADGTYEADGDVH